MLFVLVGWLARWSSEKSEETACVPMVVQFSTLYNEQGTSTKAKALSSTVYNEYYIYTNAGVKINRVQCMCIFYFYFKMFYSCKSQFREKNPVLPIEKFPSLVLPRNAIMLQHLIIQFPLYYLSSGRLRKVKNKRKF